MIQRQVIVTWYTPEEKTPGENEGVIATVSGDVNGAIIFDRAIVLMCWSKEYGWYSEEYSFTHLTVHAWCDLEAYEGQEGGENMMDLESAIKHCEEVADTPCFTDEEAKCYSEHRQLAEWLKELKAYKEQSGDAISRQEVDDAIYDYSRSCNVDYSQIMEYIEKLPSVTPQQKTGRWIFHESFDNGHKNCNECIECNQCHTWLSHDCYAKTPYCPICGAKIEVSGCTKNI